MKIAIIGAGAMGSLFGAYLSKFNEVFLIGNKEKHIAAINREGLAVLELDGSSHTIRCKAVTGSAEIGNVDLLILFVKATQTLSENRSLIGASTILLSLQNGYGNADDMLALAGKEQIIIGTTNQACTMKRPGCIYHTGAGKTHIGALVEDQSKAETVARLLCQAGFETEISDQAIKLVWRKLFINVGINPITAILGQTNSCIAEKPYARLVSKCVVFEAVAIANADGMGFDPVEIFENVCQIALLTGKNRSSMLSHITNRTQTEILKINGAVVKRAGQLGLKAEYNTLLTNLILAMEERSGNEPQLIKEDTINETKNDGTGL